MNRALGIIGAELEDFCEVLPYIMTEYRALKEIGADLSSLPLRRDIRLEALSAPDLVSLLDRIEALPGCRRLRAFCAAPENDVCLTLELLRMREYPVLVVVVDPARAYRDSAMLARKSGENPG